MHNFNDNSLPYDNLITAQILDAVELELMDKASAHGDYDEKTEEHKKQTATSHKLRVEIVTDIDKTKTLLTAPAGCTLDMSFVDTIWLRIIDLFNQSQPEPDPEIDDMLSDFDDFNDDFSLEPDYEFLFGENDDDGVEDEFGLKEAGPKSAWEGCNVTLSLKNEAGVYFISSYFQLEDGKADLLKLIVDDDVGNPQYRTTGDQENPFELKISITSLDQPIQTKRF